MTSWPSGDAGAAAARSLTLARGPILALDYGRVRIGLALTDEEAGLARPLATLVRKNRNDDMRRLREIVREHGVKLIVVGLPLRLDGTRGLMAEEAERFATRLRKQVGLPVELMDERLTSREAERLMEERRISKGDKVHAEKKRKTKKGKTGMDAVAAAVILREYLERERAAKERR